MQCGTFSSILGPLLDASTIFLTLSHDNQKHLQTLPDVPGEAKLPPVKNHRSSGAWVTQSVEHRLQLRS